MKLFALALALLISVPRFGSAQASSLKSTLQQLEEKSWVAWKGRDGGYFQNFLSADHVEMGFGGPSTKTVVVAGVSSPMCVVSDYSLDNFSMTQFSRDAAVLTYHASQNTLCGGKPVPSPVWVSSLYVLRNGRWLNALYQQTPDATKH